MGQGFLITLAGHFPHLKERERERESQGFHSSKAHTLECQDRDLSHRTKDLGYTRPPKMQGYSAHDIHRLNAPESHRTNAQELHGTHIGRVHKNRMGHAQAACTRIAWNAHMGSSIRERLQFFQAYPSTNGFRSRNIQITSMSFKSLNIYSIMIFEAIIFRYIRFREPQEQMHTPYEIQGMGTE